MNIRFWTLLVVLLTAATAATASSNAWMYGNQPTATNYVPNPLHSYNPACGAITVQRFAAGVYRITFAKLVTMTGDRANVQVTPYGNGNANCHVMDWVTTAPPDFITHVRCYNNTTNTNIDSEYTLLVTFN
jgi:hypothetical protein